MRGCENILLNLRKKNIEPKEKVLPKENLFQNLFII